MRYSCIRSLASLLSLVVLLITFSGFSLVDARADELHGKVQLDAGGKVQLNKGISNTTFNTPPASGLTTIRSHGYAFSQGCGWGCLDFMTFIPEPSLSPSSPRDPRHRFAEGIDEIMQNLLVDSSHSVKIEHDVFDPNCFYSKSAWSHGPLAYRLDAQHKALIVIMIDSQGSIFTQVLESNLPGDLTDKLTESIQLLASTKKERDELTNYWNVAKPVSVIVRVTFPVNPQPL